MCKRLGLVRVRRSKYPLLLTFRTLNKRCRWLNQTLQLAVYRDLHRLQVSSFNHEAKNRDICLRYCQRFLWHYYELTMALVKSETVSLDLYDLCWLLWRLTNFSTSPTQLAFLMSSRHQVMVWIVWFYGKKKKRKEKSTLSVIFVSFSVIYIPFSVIFFHVV